MKKKRIIRKIVEAPDYINVTIKMPLYIAKELSNKFPHIKEMTYRDISSSLVDDLLGDFSWFDPRFYTLADIKDLFDIKN